MVTDFFRDFGIISFEVSRPAEKVRSYLPWGHVIGQYIGMSFVASIGNGMGIICALGVPFPVNVLAVPVPLMGFGFLIYLATRNDYAWVELDGETIRAQHLYTRKVTERSVDDVEDLLTLVFQVRIGATLITEALVGRIRGIMIRFRDKRTPFQVARADPAMTNAKELIEAIIFRMSEKGEIDAEVID